MVMPHRNNRTPPPHINRPHASAKYDHRGHPTPSVFPPPLLPFHLLLVSSAFFHPQFLSIEVSTFNCDVLRHLLLMRSPESARSGAASPASLIACLRLWGNSPYFPEFPLLKRAFRVAFRPSELFRLSFIPSVFLLPPPS